MCETPFEKELKLSGIVINKASKETTRKFFDLSASEVLFPEWLQQRYIDKAHENIDNCIRFSQKLELWLNRRN